MHISRHAFDTFEEMHKEFNENGECRVKATLSLSRGLKAILASRRKKDQKWFSVEFSETVLEPDEWEETENGGVLKYVLTLRAKRGKPTGPEAGRLRSEGLMKDTPQGIGSRKKDIEEWIARDAEKNKIPLIQRRNPKREIVWPSTIGGHEEQWFGWWAQNESMNEMFAKGYISRRTMRDANFMWGPPRETWTRELVEQVATVWAGETEETGQEPSPDGWLGQFKAYAQKSGWL